MIQSSDYNNALKSVATCTQITTNYAEIVKGGIFIAIHGFAVNGEKYVMDAFAKGAAFAITSLLYPVQMQEFEHKIIRVKNPRKFLSLLAAEFYQHQPRAIVAITGTSGKTSVANFYRQIVELASESQLKTAMIGTLGVFATGLAFDNKDSLTSPDPIKLHQILKQLSEAGINHLAIEASSHGLHQHRTDGVKITSGAFTNLSRDHLDYHADEQEYFAAKCRLFKDYNLKNAVLNADIPQHPELLAICKNKSLNIINFGSAAKEIKILTQEPAEHLLKLEIFGKKFAVPFHLAGDFQKFNVACAAGLAIVEGLDIEAVMASISNLKAAPGRMQRVAEKEAMSLCNSKIFVDYCHKPEALQKAIQSLRYRLTGRLIIVFGCGGDRDAGKRIIMGQIASENADMVIVTDDNPRTEDAAAIRTEILKGCPKAFEIGERAEAIAFAISRLQPGDRLLIAGKGHEDYQIIGKEKHHFSDQEEVMKCLTKK